MSVAVGIVGAGEIVRKVHLPVLQSLGGVRVAWLHDAAPQRARSVGEAYGVPVASATTPAELPDCDVVLLAVPAPVRASYLESLAQRGIAVFCEKPFALTAEEHRRYLQWFEPHRLACGYMRRFYRSTRIIEQVVRRGWLGPLRVIRVAEGGRSRGSGSGESFLDDPRFAAAGGVLMDLGTHTLDLALRLAGCRSFNVERSALTLDGDVDRHAEARVRIGDAGVLLDYQVSWLARQSNRLTLEFDDVCLWCNLSPDACVFLGDPQNPRDAVELGAGSAGATTPNQAFALEWREFLDGLAGGIESRISARSALPTTELAEAIRLGGSVGHA